MTYSNDDNLSYSIYRGTDDNDPNTVLAEGTGNFDGPVLESWSIYDSWNLTDDEAE